MQGLANITEREHGSNQHNTQSYQWLTHETPRYVTLDVIIAKHLLQVHFYVMPVGTMEEHAILWHSWYYLTNCQIDWHKQSAKMVYKGNATQVSLLHESLSMQPPTPKSGDSTAEKGKGKQALTQNTSPTETSQSPNPTHVASTA